MCRPSFFTSMVGIADNLQGSLKMLVSGVKSLSTTIQLKI